MTTDCQPDHHPSSPHGHDHGPPGHERKLLKSRIKMAFLISFGLMGFEAVGGWWSGSLSLVADSLHVLADAAAMGMVLLTSWLAESPRSHKRSFGYYRLEILSALFNGLLLIFTTLFIFRSAFERWQNPVAIQSSTMLFVSIAGLVANLLMLFLLRERHSIDAHSHSHQHLNLRSAYLHVLGDTLSSVAVVIGAIILKFTAFSQVDTYASIFVGLMIVILSARLIYDSVHILLEGTPKHLDPEEIQKALQKQFPAIVDIHDLHIWEITSHLPSMTAHIGAKINSMKESQELIDHMNKLMKEHYGIRHTTFQIEARN